MADTARLKRAYDGLENVTLLYNPTRKEIDQTLLENDDDLVMCLGHGSPHGLFGTNWRGYAIDSENAKLLKSRKVIGIWCYASEFADANKLNGYFTSMFISNLGEALSHGFIKHTNEDIYSEIDFFCDQIKSFIQNGTEMNCWVKILQDVCHKEKDYVRFNYEAMAYFENSGTEVDNENTSNFKTSNNMEEKKYCPNCGHEFVQGESNFNYETGNTDYHCTHCEWEGTQFNIMTLDGVLDDLEDEKEKHELDGVEISTEDAELVITKVKNGESYNDAISEVLAGIRSCLDEGLEEEEDDLSDKLDIYTGDYADGYLYSQGLFIMTWPDSQELCEKPEFYEHAWLIDDEEGLEMYGSSSYVVEKKWWDEVSK